MKMNVEFNSNEDLLEFIKLFGAGTVQLFPAKKEEVKDDVQEVEQHKETTVKGKKQSKPAKTTKPVQETPPVEQAKEEPVQESASKPVVTKTLLSTNLKKLAKSKGNAVAKSVVQEFGYNKLPEVEEKDFEALNNKMLELIRG